MLAVTAAGRDRVDGAADDRRRAGQAAAARPRTWVTIGAALPAAHPRRASCSRVTEIGPRPGEGPAFLSAVLSNGALFPAGRARASCCRCSCRSAVAVIAGDAIAGEATAGTLRYLLVRPVGRTRLLVAKLVAVMAFVLLAVVAGRRRRRYLVGRAAARPRRRRDLDHRRVSGRTLTATAARRAHRAGRCSTSRWSMLGVAAIALFLSTLTDSPLGAALGCARGAHRLSRCW